MKGYSNKINILISKTTIPTFFCVALCFLLFQNVFFSTFYYLLSVYDNYIECLKFSFSIQFFSLNYDNYNGITFIIIYIQSILNVILWGIYVSFLTMKFLFPSKQTIVFSPYAFYLTEENQFCVMLVNTTKSHLENLHFLTVEKYYRRHRNTRNTYLPYLKNSVLNLKIGETDILSCDPKDFDPMEDGLKVSLSCSLPFSNYTISMKYNFFHIIMIENTEFRDIPLLQEPDLKSDVFWSKFNQPITEPFETLGDYFKKGKKIRKQ